MPIVLYGLRVSVPYRAALLTARALGVDVEEREVDVHDKQEHKTEAYLKMNPTHTIPTLDDNGFYLWESRAIMCYLVNHYGKDSELYPKDPQQRAIVDNMLYFDASALFACIQHFVVPVVSQGAPEDPAAKARVVEKLGFLDDILKGRKYAAGQRLTIADFAIVCSVTCAEAIGVDLREFTNVRAWVKRVEAEVPFYEEVTKEGEEKMKAFLAARLKK